MPTHVHMHTRMHTSSHTPITTFTYGVSKLHFSASILGRIFGTTVPLLIPVPTVSPCPKMSENSSRVALSRLLTHGVTHCEPRPHLWVSQPGLAWPVGDDEGTVPLHFSHPMVLSTKDRPRSDLAEWDELSAGHCPGHGRKQSKSVPLQVWSTTNGSIRGAWQPVWEATPQAPAPTES